MSCTMIAYSPPRLPGNLQTSPHPHGARLSLTGDIGSLHSRSKHLVHSGVWSILFAQQQISFGAEAEGLHYSPLRVVVSMSALRLAMLAMGRLSPIEIVQTI